MNIKESLRDAVAHVSAADAPTLTSAILRGAEARLRKRVGHVRELEDQSVLMLSPEEQYLVSTGRVYFRDLSFDQIRRMQFDLETTGLDPAVDRIFMVAVRDADGIAETLEAHGTDDAAVISGDLTGTVLEAGGVANGTPGIPGATGDLEDRKSVV